MYLALILLGIAKFAVAQIYTSCNPITNASCPPNPALGTTFAWDFRNGASDSFTTDSWWLPYIRYDSINGATLTVNRSGIAPTLTSKFYILFGRLDIVIRTAAGTGIVTDVIFESDDQDEIDLEWVASSPKTVQSNYYSPRGRGPVFNQMQLLTTTSSMQTQFRTYTVDWNADRLSWSIDGILMRTVNSTGNDQYPQTPMKITMGLWAGGDPSNSPYTVYWAGGYTNYSRGPFEMSVQSVKVTDYSTGSAYSYGDRSGLYESIQAANGSIRPHATAALNSNTVSSFAIPASLLPSITTAMSSSSARVPTIPTVFPLPVSSNGHCGEAANSSTCAGSLFGDCCSAYGYCGSTADYCGDGCLQYYGLCGNQTLVRSTLSTPTATIASSSNVSGAPTLPTYLPVLGISPGGYCGLSNGSNTCLGSGFGDCCSQYDSCGSDIDWCGSGCQPSFGNCNGYPNQTLPATLCLTTTSMSTATSSVVSAPPIVSGISVGGYCGVSNGSTTCTGSGFGSCCSQWDSCGNTDEYCGFGCQPAFGSCNGPGTSSLLPTSSVVASSSSSSLTVSTALVISASSSQFSGSSSSLSFASSSPTPGSTLLLIPSSSSFTTILSSSSSTSSSTSSIVVASSSALSPVSSSVISVSSSSSTASSSSTTSSSSTSSIFTSLSSSMSSSSASSAPTAPQYTSTSGATGPPSSVPTVVSTSTSSSISLPVFTQQAPSVVSSSSSSKSSSTSISTKATTTSLASYGSSTVLKASSSSTSSASSSSSAPTTLTTFSCPGQNGTAYLSPYSAPNKVYKLLCNSDLSTTNTISLGWGGGNSLFRCIQSCETKTGCVAVTYAPWFGTGACFYKGSVGTVTTVNNASLAILTGTQKAGETVKPGYVRRWMAW